MRNITLVIGKKGAGKSEWILKKKDMLRSEGWEEIEAINEKDRNTAIFVLKSSKGEIAILNSGSDTREIIENFGRVLNRYKEALHIFTAIRPIDINSSLHKWMITELNIQEDDVVNRVEL